MIAMATASFLNPTRAALRTEEVFIGRGGSEVAQVVASGSKWREGAGGLREACQARSGPLSDRSWPRRKQALELAG